jgi:hypothetical protein
MAVGRISGPLLKDNLLRDGVNLAFETDLLFLDVVNGRVGIKTATPTNELSVNGTTRTTNLEVVTQATVANFTLSGSTIASSSGTITLVPSGANPAIYQSKILVNSNLQISTNTIETTVNNTDINISTLGTGQVIVNADTRINGNLHATGTITADGNITLGDANTDNIIFNADVASNIIPDITNTYSLGSNPSTGGKEWANLYAHNIYATTINTTSLLVNGINLVLPQGNIIYVSTTGSNSNAGVHENNPVLTIKYALSLATSGTTVYIYPGNYQEIFPLTIPVGVSIKGAGVRAVNITPTVGTITNDAFLLNGETTVEELSVGGFRYSSGSNTGYAFRFANNFTVTTRSPYIRDVTVITRGSTTSGSDPYGFDSNDAGKGILADGSVANALSKEASMLFHGVTFFTPNQETITATNGVRIEWLNSFSYFADKSIYAYSGSTGFAGAGQTQLRINNRTGTWAVGNTVNYYDTDGTTVLGTGTIASVSGNYVNLTGKCLGFETVTDRIPTTLYAQGNAKLSTAQKKFGTASLILDGTGDYVTHPTAPDFGFGTNDFCLELWVYPTSTGTYRTIFDLRDSSGDTGGIILGITDANQLYFYYNGNYRIGPVGTIPQNTWTHVALSRASGTTKAFINGTQVGSNYVDFNNYASRGLRIGADPNGSFAFTGYIDDVRISKGVARYTGTFVAPTTALVGDLDTVLLLHLNGTNNSTTFLDDGITLQDLRTSAGGTASLIQFADYSDFGAEIRALGSASIYGTYGVYGDGPGVIIYLVSHNLSYVGAGKLSTNDPNNRISANEIVELNRAKIYYTSVDNEGNFKVGDNFYVNQKTGDVTFNNQNLSINSLLGVTFTDGTNTTTLLSTGITTGNIQISGNTVESLTGPLNVVAANGIINLQNNTFVTGNLDVTGNVTIGGNITIGDANTDSINFIAAIASNLVPSPTATYNLGQGGGTPLRWNNAYLSRAEIDGLVIDSNTISTTVGNDNLTLVANGTGKVLIPSNSVQIDQSLVVGQNLTVTTGSTSLQAVGITGTLTQTGNFTQTSGNFSTTGTINSGAITSTGILTLPNITIANSTVTGTTTATNLVLTPYTGRQVEITSNAQLDGSATIGGTLGVTGISTLAAVGITGTLTQTGNFTQTSGNFSTTGTINSGAITSTGTLTLPNVTIANSTITGTTTATNLVLTPYSGKQVEITSNAQLDGSATVGGTLGVTGISTLAAVGITGTLTQTCLLYTSPSPRD